MPGDVNRQWILRDRPKSQLTESDFELRRTPVPEPGPGEALTRTLYISVDAANRNVGGPILEAALFQMRGGGRIVCCGAVSQYDTGSPGLGPRGVPGLLVVKRLRMEGFIVMDFYARWREAEDTLARLIAEGRLVIREDIVEGLERAPQALIGLLRGDNIGKRMVRVTSEPD